LTTSKTQTLKKEREGRMREREREREKEIGLYWRFYSSKFGELIPCGNELNQISNF
jgi:hypothetical protein